MAGEATGVSLRNSSSISEISSSSCYEDVRPIEYKSDLVAGKITMYASGDKAEITNVSDDQCRDSPRSVQRGSPRLARTQASRPGPGRSATRAPRASRTGESSRPRKRYPRVHGSIAIHAERWSSTRARHTARSAAVLPKGCARPNPRRRPWEVRPRALRHVRAGFGGSGRSAATGNVALSSEAS
jgi:hypothetical protein